MRSLRFAGALLVAILLHAGGTLAWSDFPRAVDVFLIVVVLYSAEASPAASLLMGLTAGLVSDAFAGGPYGLYGFADTMLGYGSAVLAQRLVVRQLSSIMFLLALAAAAQQAILVALSLLLVPGSPLPGVVWVVVKVATAAALGALLLHGRNLVFARVLGWRSRRGAKLR